MAQRVCRYVSIMNGARQVLFHHRVHQVFKQHLVCISVWEKDKKGGYRKPNPVSHIEMIKDGLKMMGSELEKFGDEMNHKFRADPFINIRDGDYEYIWKFNDRKKVDEWIVSSDRDNNEGQSQANLTFSTNNTALFHGHLSQQVPKDGVVKHTGYCNIRSPTKFMSFKREDNHDWSCFTHLLMRVRGDGRPYMVTISVDRFFDINWFNQYHYTLFTRGGPYWQIAKIPFSKFFVTSKGRIQDKQEPIQLERITHLGITVGDGNQGPFYLEIDYIACMFDENHREVFAYESYATDPAHVNT